VQRAECAQSRTPAGATLVLAAWICCLRGHGAPVVDVHAQTMVSAAGGPLPEAVGQVLHELDPILGEDAEGVDVVRQQCEQLVHEARA
jgi:fructuronate reductase